MKLFSLIIIALFLANNGFSQNLVPNGSFESHSSCPQAYELLHFATPWVKPSNTGIATPDLFSACSSGLNSVPTSGIGYQQARTGQSYAGFYTFGYGVREYIQVQLSSSLQAGVTYEIEMYVSPAEQNGGVAVDHIGMHISNGPISGTGSNGTLPFTPQISNPSGIF